MELNHAVQERLVELRPQLSKQSLQTYSSLLCNLYKNCFAGKPETFESVVENLALVDPVVDYLKQRSPCGRKACYSALFVFTKIPKYREHISHGATTPPNK